MKRRLLRTLGTGLRLMASATPPPPGPASVASTVAARAHLNSSKYTDSYGDFLSVSSEVMRTIISEALQRRDSKTLHAVIAQANQVGKLTSEVLEDALMQCLDAKDLENATLILKSCGLLSGKVISPALCQELLGELVNHCQWTQASVVLEYMLRFDIRCTGEREVFHVIGGLMRDTAGVARALQLMTVITEKRRGDLALVMSYKKVNRFALNNSLGRIKKDLPREYLEQLARASLSAQQSRWCSFTLSKMLTALACASGNHDIATDFIRSSVRILTDRLQEARDAASAKSRRASMQEQALFNEAGAVVDMLSLLRCFSQGAGVASDDDGSYRSTWAESPASLLLLDLSVEQLQRGTVAFSGPLKAMQFMHMYWVLCHRSGRSRVVTTPAQSLPSARRGAAGEARPPIAPAPALAAALAPPASHADPALQSAYADLATFMASEKSTMLCRPAPGYQRRALRVLCDELGLRHQMGKFDTPDEVIKVWKDKKYVNAKLHTPLSLDDILHTDARRGNLLRRFDGVPTHWPVVQRALGGLSPKSLSTVLPNVVSSMLGYPAPEWALLLLETLQLEDGPPGGGAPTGLLRAALKMCAQRSDVYGLLEVLHLNAQRASPEHSANSTNSITNSSAKQEARRMRSLSSPSSAPPLSSSSRDAQASSSSFDDEDPALGLRESDWNQACNLAYHCRVANMPAASYDAAFTEVVRLMREAGVEFDDGTLRTLLRYLVYSQPHSELTARITSRLHKDKTLAITHIECAALTLHMLRRLGPVHGAKTIVMTKPVYQAEAYILLYPEAFAHIMDMVVTHSDFLGESFLQSFEAAWSSINHKTGRVELYKLLARTTSPEGRRQALVEDPGRDARAAVTCLVVYSAYLMSFFESEHRKAFDLLYAVEAIHLDAKAFERSRETEDEGDEGDEESEEEERETSRR